MYQRPVKDLNHIVIHHSVTSRNRDIDYYIDFIRQLHMEREYSDIGYHYIVRSDGMNVGRSISFNGAHALGEKVRWSPNRKAIGICMIGDYSKEDPSAKLINETAYLVKRLCDKYGIPKNQKCIIGHSDVDYTACPGTNTMKLLYEKLGI